VGCAAREEFGVSGVGGGVHGGPTVVYIVGREQAEAGRGGGSWDQTSVMNH